MRCVTTKAQPSCSMKLTKDEVTNHHCALQQKRGSRQNLPPEHEQQIGDQKARAASHCTEGGLQAFFFGRNEQDILCFSKKFDELFSQTRDLNIHCNKRAESTQRLKRTAWFKSVLFGQLLACSLHTEPSGGWGRNNTRLLTQTCSTPQRHAEQVNHFGTQKPMKTRRVEWMKQIKPQNKSN